MVFSVGNYQKTHNYIFEGLRHTLILRFLQFAQPNDV